MVGQTKVMAATAAAAVEITATTTPPHGILVLEEVK
jgi:hypothetical protein